MRSKPSTLQQAIRIEEILAHPPLEDLDQVIAFLEASPDTHFNTKMPCECPLYYLLEDLSYTGLAIQFEEYYVDDEVLLDMPPVLNALQRYWTYFQGDTHSLSSARALQIACMLRDGDLDPDPDAARDVADVADH